MEFFSQNETAKACQSVISCFNDAQTEMNRCLSVLIGEKQSSQVDTVRPKAPPIASPPGEAEPDCMFDVKEKIRQKKLLDKAKLQDFQSCLLAKIEAGAEDVDSRKYRYCSTVTGRYVNKTAEARRRQRRQAQDVDPFSASSSLTRPSSPKPALVSEIRTSLVTEKPSENGAQILTTSSNILALSTETSVDASSLKLSTLDFQSVGFSGSSAQPSSAPSFTPSLHSGTAQTPTSALPIPLSSLIDQLENSSASVSFNFGSSSSIVGSPPSSSIGSPPSSTSDPSPQSSFAPVLNRVVFQLVADGENSSLPLVGNFAASSNVSIEKGAELITENKAEPNDSSQSTSSGAESIPSEKGAESVTSDKRAESKSSSASSQSDSSSLGFDSSSTTVTQPTFSTSLSDAQSDPGTPSSGASLPSSSQDSSSSNPSPSSQSNQKLSTIKPPLAPPIKRVDEPAVATGERAAVIGRPGGQSESVKQQQQLPLAQENLEAPPQSQLQQEKQPQVQQLRNKAEILREARRRLSEFKGCMARARIKREECKPLARCCPDAATCYLSYELSDLHNKAHKLDKEIVLGRQDCVHKKKSQGKEELADALDQIDAEELISDDSVVSQIIF